MPLFQRDIDRISGNDPDVTSIDLSSRGLLNKEIIDMLLPLLKGNEHITEVILSRNNFDSSGAKALATLRRLKKLDLSNTNVGDEAATALAQSGVEYLTVSRTSMTAEGAEIFVTHSRQLYLDLSRNGLEKEVLKRVGEKIRANNKDVDGASAEKVPT